MFRPFNQNAIKSTDEVDYTGFTNWKATDRQTKDQVSWSRLGVGPAEQSELAENREVFRVLLSI